MLSQPPQAMTTNLRARHGARFWVYCFQSGNVCHFVASSKATESMSTGPAFALRPLERNPPSAPSNALEGSFRVHFSQKEQKHLGLTNGDLIRLSTSAGFKGYGVAWTASQTNPGNKPIAKVTDLLREHYELALNDPVFVEKVTDPWKPLKSVEVTFLDSSEQVAKFVSSEELLYWVQHALGRLSCF